MREIAEWVRRLNNIETQAKAAESGEVEPPKIQEFYFPLLVRGFTPVTLTGSFFAIEPLQRIVQRSGDPAPIAQSLLRIPDVPSAQGFANHGLADELTALVCASLQGWVDVVKALPIKVEGSQTTSFMITSSMVDGNLNRPIGDLPVDPLTDWISRVASLQSPHDEVIGAAIRLHHGAVMLFEHDLRAAYVLCVAGIEVLSRQYGSPRSEWNSWEDSSKWDKLFQEMTLDDGVRQRLRDALLADKHLRLKLTFRQYAANALPDAFWNQPYKIWNYGHHAPSGSFLPAELFSEKPISELLSTDRDALSRSLGKSYDIRSGLVHRGETLSFFDAAIAPWNSVDGSKLVPFGLLRTILLALIDVELTRHSSATTMPAMKWSWATRTE